MTFVPLLGAAVVQVLAAWSRPAIDEGVVYATLRNTTSRPVTLVGASSPVARHAELHRSMAMHEMNGMNAMGMRPVARVTIPAHGTLRLQPGGDHVMLLGLRQQLAAGQRFPVTFRFAGGGTARGEVQVENRAL